MLTDVAGLTQAARLQLDVLPTSGTFDARAEALWPVAGVPRTVAVLTETPGVMRVSLPASRTDDVFHFSSISPSITSPSRSTVAVILVPSGAVAVI